MGKMNRLQEEIDRLRAAISWVEPPFVDETTSDEELRKRVAFLLKDAQNAAALRRELGETSDE